MSLQPNNESHKGCFDSSNTKQNYSKTSIFSIQIVVQCNSKSTYCKIGLQRFLQMRYICIEHSWIWSYLQPHLQVWRNHFIKNSIEMYKGFSNNKSSASKNTSYQRKSTARKMKWVRGSEALRRSPQLVVIKRLESFALFDHLDTPNDFAIRFVRLFLFNQSSLESFIPSPLLDTKCSRTRLF